METLNIIKGAHMRGMFWKCCSRSFFLIAILISGILWNGPAAARTFDSLAIDFKFTTLEFDPRKGPVKIIGAGTRGVSMSGWEIKRVDERHFHVRRNTWTDFFWDADIISHGVHKVIGGSFGESGKEGTLVKELIAVYEAPPGSKGNDEPLFQLALPRITLNYDPRDGSLRIVAAGEEIIGKQDLEITCFTAEPRELCQIRYRKQEQGFWEISLKEKRVSWAVEGNFGSPDGLRQDISLMAGLKVEKFKPVIGTFEDLGFTEVNETRHPRSEWIESRKALYGELLKQNTYDVLIVPFQVQGYAVDRVSRSTMTRYLADRIAGSTGLRTPDPTVVARALGEDARIIDENEIYRLANELKVRFLIRGSVGHDRDEKLRLTLLVQESDDGRLAADSKLIRLDWRDIPFSDEHPAEFTFNELLDEVAAKLPFKVAGKSAPTLYRKEPDIPLPESLLALVTGKPASPVIGAYYLQFLGMLFPDDSTAMEHLFERSLVVLKRVSSESPDYPLLKARALFYLHRRPAALAALGTPSTAEEKALLALMDGNLPELKKTAALIKSPLPKIIAHIELNDLRWSYKERVGSDDYKWLSEEFPNWEMVVNRRLQAGDKWYSQDNLQVKQQMDAIFPIANFSLDELLTSKMFLGESPRDNADVDLSVYEHYRRSLGSKGRELWPGTENQYPVKGDCLDLLYANGESNLLRSIYLTMFMQGLEESALEQMNSYDKVYRGHPAMTYLKGSALAKRWKGNRELDYLLKERDDLYFNAYYWSGGQVRFIYSNNFRYYDADYPTRAFWQTVNGDRAELKGDKILDSMKSQKGNNPIINDQTINQLKNTSLGLKYSHDNFYILKSYYEQLVNLQKEKHDQADALLEENRKRFAGNPERIEFYVKLNSNSADPLQRIKVMEDAIAAAPDLWESYQQLGRFYMNRGEFGKALETFLKYPLFGEGVEGDRVEMSNEAVEAALSLRWRGAIEESLPFFRIAANSNTGSGAEMMSAAILALQDGDYAGAASNYLRLIRRYQDSQGYRDYMTSLHLMGFHQESWSIFNTVDVQTNSPEIWTSALIGQRMEAKTGDEITRWLMEDHFNKVDAAFIANYLLMSRLIDRAPEQKLPELIKTTMKGLKSPPEEYTSEQYRPNAAVFAEGYSCARKGDYDKGHEILKQWITYLGYPSADFAVPYRVWCGVKAKRTAEIDEFFKTIENEYDKSPGAGLAKSYYYISKAYFYGLQGNHQEAIENLKLVDACEWLYKDTGYAGYRTLALEWAKLHQRILPWFAWAYAVEAKYATSDADRLRALAIALYLDKNSERIADIPETEKARARKWLEQNNPFLKFRDDPGVVEKSAA
jgi:hypothetical protein